MKTKQKGVVKLAVIIALAIALLLNVAATPSLGQASVVEEPR